MFFDTQGHNCSSDIYKKKQNKYILAHFTFSWSSSLGGGRREGGHRERKAGVGTDLQVLIARGGSSSPGLCTSHTNAADAPCSGRRHPSRRASPEDAGKIENTTIHIQHSV